MRAPLINTLEHIEEYGIFNRDCAWVIYRGAR